MVGVPLRRINRCLQVETAIDVTHKDMQGPLLLLIASWRPVGEPRLAISQHQSGRKCRPGSYTGRKRRWQPFFQPEHLSARPERPTQRGNRGRTLQPTATWGRRDKIAPAVCDVEVDCVTPRWLAIAKARLQCRSKSWQLPEAG